MNTMLATAIAALLVLSLAPTGAAWVKPPPVESCTEHPGYTECCYYDAETGEELYCDIYYTPGPPGQGCRPVCLSDP